MTITILVHLKHTMISHARYLFIQIRLRQIQSSGLTTTTIYSIVFSALKLLHLWRHAHIPRLPQSFPTSRDPPMHSANTYGTRICIIFRLSSYIDVLCLCHPPHTIYTRTKRSAPRNRQYAALTSFSFVYSVYVA